MESIPNKETSDIEFKSDLKRLPDSELLDEVIAFANTTGGIIYLGVEDNGKITGVNNLHKDPVGVAALIANKTVPPVYVQTEIVEEETENGKQEVLAIMVPKSKTIVASSSGKIMRRRLKLDGTPEVIPMYPYEIPTRLSALDLLDYTALALPHASVSDFDNAEIVRLKSVIAEKPKSDKNLLELDDEEIEKSLHLITRDEKDEYVPTVAGILLIGKKEKIAQYVPTMRAEFQVLSGSIVRVNDEIKESVLSTIQKFETYLDAWNPESEFENGMYRIGIPEFDKDAFREAAVNAFCHRDYTQLGAVRVQIDDEGFSITSPGTFMDGISSQNILTVEPHGRNPLLADILKRIGLAEKTGRGIDRIFEGQLIYGRRWPDYSESTDRYVRVYLQRGKPDFAFFKLLKDTERKQNKRLPVNQLLILSLLKNGETFTTTELLERTGMSESRFDFSIRSLLELNIIGTKSKGKQQKFFMLKPTLLPERQKNISVGLKILNPQDDFAKVVEAARWNNNVISKDELATALSLTPAQAYSLIKKYVAEGKMRLIQSGKYAKYEVTESGQ